MNFFERQAAARRTSTRLVVLFSLAVVAIVLAVDAAVFLVAGANAGLLAFATLATVGVIGIGSLYRLASLRSGGEAVALQMGGTAVPEQTTDLHLRRLRNVVEEISIASGVPMPALYVMEHEPGINAFAAGYAPEDAAIAVTRGALDRLNRDELQGVIAHEFSHVLNGDMRLNIRLMGVLFGIMMISLIGRKILQHGGGRGRGTTPVLLAAVVALVIGGIGLLFGRMIKAGVSRTRERLADASAVQFTRQTSGLAGALKKIGGLQDGARLTDRGDAEEISHMLFGDGVGFRGVFATHPPLLERIRALEPTFATDGLQTLQARWFTSPPDGLQEDLHMGLSGRDAVRLPPADAMIDITAPMVASQVAKPQADDYARADAIVTAMPAALRKAASRQGAALPLMLALLLSDDARVARLQRIEITARMGESAALEAARLREVHLADLHPMLRLPLAALAFPTLRMRPRPQLDTFLDTVHAVVHSDGRVSLFEYCLGTLLQVQVREALSPGRHARFGRRKPAGVKQEFATLLAVVAAEGHPDDAAARRAYLAGLQRVLPRDHVPYVRPSGGVQALDGVWDALDGLDPLAKQLVVEAVTDAVTHDGRVSVTEAELLRTICGVLHCPLPPMLDHA